MDEFDQKSAMDEVFIQRLTVSFPVDHVHVVVCPLVPCHYVISDGWGKGFTSDGAAVSRGNGLSLAVELGSVAGKARDGGCFMAQGSIVCFGECIHADVQLGLNHEVFKGNGVVLMGFYVNEIGAVGKHSNGGCYLLDDILVRL